jgi:hypothetical protein
MCLHGRNIMEATKDGPSSTMIAMFKEKEKIHTMVFILLDPFISSQMDTKEKLLKLLEEEILL